MSTGATVDPECESIHDEEAATAATTGDSSAGALTALVPVNPYVQQAAAIRIGPPRHGFVYEYNNGAWVCRRGSEWAIGMERLVRN